MVMLRELGKDTLVLDDVEDIQELVGHMQCLLCAMTDSRDI